MITKAEAAAAIRATTAPGKERAKLLDFVDELIDDQLHQWLIQPEHGHETIVDFIKQKAERAVAAAGGTLGFWEALFPSTLYCITFTLYDGVEVATRLVSHAKANGFRGEVQHVSTSRSDFTLLLNASDEASKQTLTRFGSWLATEVPVHAAAVETSAAFAKAAEAAAARVEVTSDLYYPLTRDRELLDMYGQGQLTVTAAVEVQLALEEAAKAVEQREGLSRSSLGKSGASSSRE